MYTYMKPVKYFGNRFVFRNAKPLSKPMISIVLDFSGLRIEKVYLQHIAIVISAAWHMLWKFQFPNWATTQGCHLNSLILGVVIIHAFFIARVGTELLPDWWCHQMETFSALLSLCTGNSPVTGEFPIQRPVTRSFGVFFDMRLNKRLSKQSRRHCAHYDVTAMSNCEADPQKALQRMLNVDDLWICHKMSL